MESLTGLPVTGRAYPSDQTIVLVYNQDWRAFEKHELTHVVSMTVWGEAAPPSSPMVEGVATWVDGRCGGFANGRVVAWMRENGALLSFDDLFGSFRARDDLIAYLQAASLLDFIVLEQGPGALETIWRGGLNSYATDAEFHGQWLAWLDSTWQSIPTEAWEEIRADGCGIDAATAAAPNETGQEESG